MPWMVHSRPPKNESYLPTSEQYLFPEMKQRSPAEGAEILKPLFRNPGSKRIQLADDFDIFCLVWKVGVKPTQWAISGSCRLRRKLCHTQRAHEAWPEEHCRRKTFEYQLGHSGRDYRNPISIADDRERHLSSSEFPKECDFSSVEFLHEWEQAAYELLDLVYLKEIWNM